MIKAIIEAIMVLVVMIMLYIVLVAYKFKRNWMKKYSKGADQ